MADLNSEMAQLTQSLDVPLAPALKAETFDPMDERFGPVPGAGEKVPVAPAAKDAKPEDGAEAAEGKESGNVSKGLQRLQRQQAEYQKGTDAKISEILQGIKTLAPAAPKAAGRLESLLQSLNGDKGKEFEALQPGITDVLKGVVEEIQELRAQPKSSENTADIKAKMAELSFEAYFARYPEEYKADFREEQNRAAEEDGYAGDRLEGYMTAWFKHYVAGKGAPAATEKPARAGAASRGILPAGSTQTRQAVDPRQQLWSGQGGNIAGVKFRK